MKSVIAATLLMIACHSGGMEEACNPDGTCNFPNLECGPGGFGYRCFVRVQKNPTVTFRSEADIFCENCLTRCGVAGLRHCAFTDVSVWGSKPTVCECRGDVMDNKPRDGGK